MKKRCKLMMLVILALVWGLGAAQTALAAKVPVYFNNNVYSEEYQLLTYAVERGGHTYVPLRVVFEACGAEVNWTADRQIIEVHYGTKRTMVMQVGSKRAVIWQPIGADWLPKTGGQVELELEAVPYLQGGSVYVPLRFVAETMGCGVQYNGGAKPEVRLKGGWVSDLVKDGRLYRLDEYSGRLTESIGGVTRELGRIDLSYFADWDQRNYGLYLWGVDRTPAGNYLAQVDITVRGAITSGGHYGCWLAPDKGLIYTVMELGYSLRGSDGEPCWLEYGDGSRELCLAGDEILFIDDETGELKQRFEKGAFKWANQDWLLCGAGSRWVLVSRRDGSVRDLSPILLSTENKARMDAVMAENFANYDEESRRWFWGYIDNELTVDTKPYISFLGEENGVLHFKMQATGDFMAYEPRDISILIDIEI